MRSMNMYTVASITHIAPNTALLTIEPQTQQDRVDFYPGQYASIGFFVGGRPTPMRSFSIVSAPNSDGILQFAFRVQGPFTKGLSRLQTGAEVRVQGAYGSFTLDPAYDQRAVFLAGGIGITPFISMLRHADATQLSMPITLVYACRSFSDIPFYDELRELAARNSQLRVYYFVSDGRIPADADNHVIAGRPGNAVFDQITSGTYRNSTYFVCGPKGLMKGVLSHLEARNIAKHAIVTESFAQASSVWERFSPARLTYGLTAAAFVAAAGIIMSIDVYKKVAQAETTTTTANTAANNTSSTANTDNSSAASASTTPANNSSSASSPQHMQSPMSSVS